MPMNALIPLMAETPDVAGSFMKGVESRDMMQEVQSKNALRAFLQEQGGAVMSGDQNALAQLAQYDPKMAWGMQGDIKDRDLNERKFGLDQRQVENQQAQFGQSLAIDQERLGIARQDARLRAQEAARTMAAEDRAAKIEEGTRLTAPLMLAYQRGDKAAWDKQNDGFEGFENIPFDQAPYAIAAITGSVEGFEAPEPIKASPGDTFLDPKTLQPLASVPEEAQGPQSGLGKVEADFKAGLITPEMYELEKARLTKSGITINTGDTGTPDGAFYEKLGEEDAKNYSAVLATAPQVGRIAAQIGQLEQTLAAIPTGSRAAIQSRAGEWGINTEGLDDIQAAQALINSMVPAQRPPGSGPMSDADLALFKQSLPRLINAPGGNQQIIGTMRAINEYDQQIVGIATQVANGEMTPAQGRSAMSEVANPLANFSASAASPASGSGSAPPLRIEVNPSATSPASSSGIDRGADKGGNRTSTGVTWSID